MTARPDPRVGTALGPYHIEAVIGRGGMGVVYRAEQAGLARNVALKVLAPALVDDEAFRVRFVRESQMAAAIDHPNILPIYEAGQIDGVYFLAMRYVEGTDLESRLQSGQLEPRETVQLLAQVASALDAASEAGLVHRDVKPANILIASSKGVEKADHAYLTDFGLTKHRGSQTGLTQSGAFMGTLDYIAPEQVEGRPVDGRTDQYSLACVAFHCLTGITPFPRDTDIAIAMAHLREQPPTATSLRPELPPDVDRVLARALAKKPDDRFPTSEGFVGALRQALGVRASEPHPMPPAAVGRSRTLVVGLVAVIAVVAIGVVGAVALDLAGTGGSAPSPSDDRTGAFPNGAEAALIARLPTDQQAGCSRGSYGAQPSFEQANSTGAGAPEPDASVVCTLAAGSGAGSVYLQSYASTEAGAAFVADRIDVVATQVGTALPGDCATSDQAHGRWAGGDLLCYQVPQYGRAWIYWTDTSSGLLGAASREDLDDRALYGWWETTANAIRGGTPSSVTGSPTGTATGDPFPTLLESSLILSLPQGSGAECERGDSDLLATRQGPSMKPRAHVVCNLLLGGQGPEIVHAWLLPFMSDIRGSDVIVALATTAGVVEGDCATGDQGGGGWDIPETPLYGGYVCWPSGDGTGSELAWSVDEAWVVYRAKLNGDDHAALHDWWITNRESIVP